MSLIRYDGTGILGDGISTTRPGVRYFCSTTDRRSSISESDSRNGHRGLTQPFPNDSPGPLLLPLLIILVTRCLLARAKFQFQADRLGNLDNVLSDIDWSNDDFRRVDEGLQVRR